MRTMIKGLLVTFLFLALPGYCDKEELWPKLIETTIQHIKEVGPSYEVSSFISRAQDESWKKRKEIVLATAPYLTDRNHDKVSGALRIFYRLNRSVPDPNTPKDDRWEYDEELSKSMARQVLTRVDYFHSLKSNSVLHSLALFLGGVRTEEAKRALLRIVQSPTSKGAREQALICLAWHFDKGDMKTLLPYMLEDSVGASSLPYHFRFSYGDAAIPYLKKAASSARSDSTRRAARKEIEYLEKQKKLKIEQNGSAPSGTGQ